MYNKVGNYRNIKKHFLHFFGGDIFIPMVLVSRSLSKTAFAIFLTFLVNEVLFELPEELKDNCSIPKIVFFIFALTQLLFYKISILLSNTNSFLLVNFSLLLKNGERYNLYTFPPSAAEVFPFLSYFQP